MNSLDKKKRERAVNFTELEIRLLVDIAIQQIHIIENKKTDAVTWKDKNEAWEKISQNFNALTGSINRNAKVLRLKYDCIKRNIKTKQSKNKLEIFKTGGGHPDPEPLTDYEEKLLAYICLSVDGLPSENDSDFLLEPIASCSTDKNKKSEEPSSVILEILADQTQNTQTNTEMEVESQFIAIQDDIIGNCDENSMSRLKWKQWNPKQLKEKKHAALLTSTPKKSVSKESLNHKINLLTDSRNDLIHLQTQIAEQEIKQKEEYAEAQQQLIKNQEDRQQEQHKQLMINMKFQHQLMAEIQDRQKRESSLREQLLSLEIENKKLEILIKRRQLQ